MHEDGRYEGVEPLATWRIKTRQQAALAQPAQLLGNAGRIAEARFCQQHFLLLKCGLIVPHFIEYGG